MWSSFLPFACPLVTTHETDWNRPKRFRLTFPKCTHICLTSSETRTALANRQVIVRRRMLAWTRWILFKSIFAQCSPNTVVTLGVLTVSIKAGCSIGGAHLGVSANSLLSYATFMPLQIFEVEFRLRRLTETGGLGVHSLTVLSLWCRAQFPIWCSLFNAGAGETALVIQSRVFSQQAYKIGAALLRCADFVAGAVPWAWRWSSACSDFVAGVVNRDCWTCGSFSEVGDVLSESCALVF